MVPDLFLDLPPAPPSNSLSGTISVDTTLFASNSPYNLVGDLVIANNVTLRH